jgi:hypothetical protein
MLRRWDMQAVLESAHAAVPRSLDRPILDSYDSGEEFSYYHWVELCRLIEQDDSSSLDEDLPLC